MRMELIFRISLFIAGIINLLPAVLAIFPDKIAKAYGIELPNANYELLLRHRAAFFGLVGGLLIYSAISRKWYEVSTLVGLFSMLSFVVLYFMIGHGIGAELKKVMQIDLIAIAVLAIGGLVYWMKMRK
jgi:hypothetical protein